MRCSVGNTLTDDGIVVEELGTSVSGGLEMRLVVAINKVL